jgi:AraC-like DNA-binding protein
MGLLFLHLLERTDCLQLSTGLRALERAAVELLGDIRTRYATFSAGAFAKAHGVSVAYISRIAREVTDSNCTALLQQRRLEVARQLLRDTDMRILSVCQAVGYDNSSYFYRIFERHEGMGPKAYRSSQRT